jgi:hypothetical protein
MYKFIIFLVFIATSPSVLAEWQRLADDKKNEIVFIDLETVMQTGPMAIYRRVNVLTQAAEIGKILSKLAVYEYDCMNTKMRILETSGFSGKWADGEKMTLPPEATELKEWHKLPSTSLGQKTFNILCPGGENS